ncbi:MAK16 protein-related [Euphorbia peplus]|nr:MAK16 protein-related [Euphorbia peplus]
MQHDEVIWQVIRHNHCSFMAKMTTGNFCRNPYNVTRKCDRSSCPLANSRYATILDHDGVSYLYMKTIERAHKPNKLWERVKLPRNFENGLKIIDKHLVYWPKQLVHKVKQRFTKMTQMRDRMRNLASKSREKVMTTPRKQIKREARREEKAEKAALLDKSIEKELVERLTRGVYGFNYKLHTKLDKPGENEKEHEDVEYEDDEDPEIEYVEGYYDLEEEDDIEDFKALGTFDGDNVEVDAEEMEKCDRKRSRRGTYLASKELAELKKKKARVVVEVEDEEAPERLFKNC